MSHQNYLKISDLLNQYEFINRIVQLMPIERIYISNHDHAQSSEVKELTILLPNSSKTKTAEAEPLISMVMADYPEYSFSVCTFQEVKRALHQGSMVFYTICTQDNLLYRAEGSAELMPAAITAKAVLKKEKRKLKRQLQRKEAKAAQVSIPERCKDEERTLELLIAKISGLLPVLRIYELARNTKLDHRSGMCCSNEKRSVEEHFYLLVICDAPCTPEIFHVQGIINQDDTIPATLTLLMHSVKEVQQALSDNQVFFHEVLRKGNLIYGSESADLAIPELDAGQLPLHKTKPWNNRYLRAVVLMEAADNVTEEQNGIVMTSMLSQAMVQLCLVYIEDRIGYRPNQLNLKHLFALCRMIDPLIDEAFPTSRIEDRLLFAHLLDADRNLRYRTQACVDTTDQCMLLRRCNAWMEQVVGKLK